MAGYRRTAADLGRGQAAPFTADNLAAVLATCPHPRRSGRGTESSAVAAARGRVDGVIAGLLFMAWMRRSEVSAVEWRDVTDATDGAGVLVAVRQSKTNPDGDTADLRYLKNGAARAVRTLRAHRTPAGATGPAPTARVVPLTGQQIGQRHRRRRHRAPRDRPQWPRGARLGTHRARRVHDRGDARRELETRPHGGPLQRRGHRRMRGRGHVSVAAGRPSHRRARPDARYPHHRPPPHGGRPGADPGERDHRRDPHGRRLRRHGHQGGTSPCSARTSYRAMLFQAGVIVGP